MPNPPKVVINGQEVTPGKKVRMVDVGLNSDEEVRKAREKAKETP